MDDESWELGQPTPQRTSCGAEGMESAQPTSEEDPKEVVKMLHLMNSMPVLCKSVFTKLSRP